MAERRRVPGLNPVVPSSAAHGRPSGPPAGAAASSPACIRSTSCAGSPAAPAPRTCSAGRRAASSRWRWPPVRSSAPGEASTCCPFFPSRTSRQRVQGVCCPTPVPPTTGGLAMVVPAHAVHVTIAHGARPRPQRAVVLHRTRSALGATMRVTPVTATVLDCATTMPFCQRPRRGGQRRRAGVRRGPPNSWPPRPWAAARAGQAAARRGGDRRAVRQRLRVLPASRGAGRRGHGLPAAARDPAPRASDPGRTAARMLRFSWEHVMFRRAWVAETVVETCRRSSRRS